MRLSVSDMSQRPLAELAGLIVPGQSLRQLLQNLDLMNAQGELVWAAELLFGNKPQHYEPVYTVKCICFMGTSITSTVFRDKMNDSVLEGNLLQMYGSIMDFLRRNLRNVQVEYGFNSVGELELPYESLIEIVVNALIHRDYAVMALSVSLFLMIEWRLLARVLCLMVFQLMSFASELLVLEISFCLIMPSICCLIRVRVVA